MQLNNARLCLDCEEIHEDPQCPVCASNSFAYIARWVSIPRPTQREPPEPPPETAVYRRLLVADALRPKAVRLVKRGALGLAAISFVRWAWRQHKGR